MARRILILLLAFAGMVLAIEGLRNAIAWWRGELPIPTLFEWASMASLPLLGWLWWRYLSPFGPGRGRCLDPSRRHNEGER
jgi:hypothetical protein